MKLEAFWAYTLITDGLFQGSQLTKLTEQKQPFQWTSEVEAAFQTLKTAMCTVPILAYPQPGERFIVNTDASNAGIGRVLFQVQDGQE
jgi:hypothetical protein